MSAFTLIEMLVVMALIGILASTLAVAAVYARRLSVRLECQGHMREIGATLNAMMLSNGGKFPDLVDSNGYPWWAKVFDQWTGNASVSIDVDKDPADGLDEIPVQLPAAMKVFHCRMGGALQNSPDEADQATRVTNLFNSISYGIHFDMKLDDKDPPEEKDTPYKCVSGTNTLETPPTDDADMAADSLYATEIKDPSRFILLSEADTQDPSPANWTGGRITMAVIDRSTMAGTEPFPQNAPIPGRHGGYANVLFADMSVDVLRADEPHWTKNVNLNTALWTLPAD